MVDGLFVATGQQWFDGLFVATGQQSGVTVCLLLPDSRVF
jgi:hypothetical protein